MDIVAQGYREGEFSYLELLMAQRTYFRANIKYVEPLRGLWTSITRVEGMLLSGGLDAPASRQAILSGRGQRQQDIIVANALKSSRFGLSLSDHSHWRP